MMPTMLSTPPSLAKIYLRGALGFLTKKHSLGNDITKLSTTIPDEALKFEIDASHVEQFNSIVNSTAAKAGTGNVSSKVPIAYPQCLINGLPMNMMTHSQFPMNIVGSIHESTEIVSHSPLDLNEIGSLQATCHIVPEIAKSDKMDWIFTVHTDIENESSNDKIMTITNQYRVLNPKRHKVKVPQDDVSKPEPTDYDNDPLWEPLATWSFPVDTGRRYALLNGDINPIHLFPITAKIFGYKSCIAHGMYSVCQLMNESIFRDGSVRAVNARFTRPTFLPSPEVKAFWKPESKSGSARRRDHDYVIGIRKDGQFKETVMGTIQMAS